MVYLFVISRGWSCGYNVLLMGYYLIQVQVGDIVYGLAVFGLMGEDDESR